MSNDVVVSMSDTIHWEKRRKTWWIIISNSMPVLPYHIRYLNFTYKAYWDIGQKPECLGIFNKFIDAALCVQEHINMICERGVE